MTILKQYMEQLKEWDDDKSIGSTDIMNAAADLGLSRFTIWSYIRKEGKNIATAEQLYSYFKSIVDRRKELIEKQEILKDYLPE